jgi:hypothetical protein
MAEYYAAVKRPCTFFFVLLEKVLKTEKTQEARYIAKYITFGGGKEKGNKNKHYFFLIKIEILKCMPSLKEII